MDISQPYTIDRIERCEHHIFMPISNTILFVSELAALPVYAHEYKLAYVNNYCDIQRVRKELISKIDKKSCLMNIEYCDTTNEYVSMYVGPTKENVLKYLCQQGLVIEQIRKKIFSLSTATNKQK